MSASVASPPTRVSTIALAGGVDAALVVLFAALGRSEHARDATLVGLFSTAWPFLAGLAVMWLVTRAARRPFAVLRTGVPVWVGTVVIGMVLRALTGAGIAVPFILVATLSLCVLLVGWRALLALVRRFRRTSALG